jgi:hypothetical protein
MLKIFFHNSSHNVVQTSTQLSLRPYEGTYKGVSFPSRRAVVLGRVDIFVLEAKIRENRSPTREVLASKANMSTRPRKLPVCAENKICSPCCSKAVRVSLFGEIFGMLPLSPHFSSYVHHINEEC